MSKNTKRRTRKLGSCSGGWRTVNHTSSDSAGSKHLKMQTKTTLRKSKVASKNVSQVLRDQYGPMTAEAAVVERGVEVVGEEDGHFPVLRNYHLNRKIFFPLEIPTSLPSLLQVWKMICQSTKYAHSSHPSVSFGPSSARIDHIVRS